MPKYALLILHSGWWGLGGGGGGYNQLGLGMTMQILYSFLVKDNISLASKLVSSMWRDDLHKDLFVHLSALCMQGACVLHACCVHVN